MAIVHAGELAGSNLEGERYGATVSVILDHSEPGAGPRLHRHPYDETWIVEEGTVTFRLGDETLSAGPGDVVIAPPDTPHAFRNDGPERLRLVCIHASPTFRTEWLE